MQNTFEKTEVQSYVGLFDNYMEFEAAASFIIERGRCVEGAMPFLLQSQGVLFFLKSYSGKKHNFRSSPIVFKDYQYPFPKLSIILKSIRTFNFAKTIIIKIVFSKLLSDLGAKKKFQTKF